MANYRLLLKNTDVELTAGTLQHCFRYLALVERKLLLVEAMRLYIIVPKNN